MDSSGNTVRIISKFLSFGTWGPSVLVSGCTRATSNSTALADLNGEESTNAVVNSYGNTASFGVIRRNTGIENVSSSDWYMPGAGEVAMIKSNYQDITDSLIAINGDVSSSDTWGNHAWLSTQHNATTAWCWQISGLASGAADNRLAQNLKNTNYNTPIFGFKKVYV